ncbi:MAG: bifunctional DNA-formamidopyrimidine glycosylase/DNA-(apurinic or apyrimidinic site) lyase [Rhizobiaceae bacterium]|nr:bifunctional DNA-formamidopyrimidine glycosylase/DNA-(apurinic or apyrimidinic site) lyase [Rhizobiaceae bacterium]MCV0405034.1 bifunctional DNA-formamidopyrimidine glycosylase/DNA-(apurinic or apyrimidinic site) lyase [Rhizobiaceae bacterium]
MPELPEVETVRRGLEPVMAGARIQRVEQRRPDLRFPFPERFIERLQGRTVREVGRRAKYLTLLLDDGLTLISHLGMSGSFRIEGAAGDELPGQYHYERSKNQAHDHVVFHLTRPDDTSWTVTFNDPRRFGFMLLAGPDEIVSIKALAGLGMEPTGNALNGEALSDLFRGRRTPLKAALLDQRLIAGLGNIYVCEALWRAGLSPMREAGSIAGRPGRSTSRADRLADAIRGVIAEAIEAGGSSLRDHMKTDGSLGYFQHSFSVYDREGEPCSRPGCRGLVRRSVQSGRSTFHCASCQR